ncbi:MAG TPA: DUF4349 domain-containing protein [Solirubrobacterales bacterium]|nr:DUF4349 domain-containing protein [Solirubrobacterales bacterium]
METPRDRDDQLAAELRALRPTPHPQFTAELDERAASGFPRRSRLPRFSLDRLRAIPPRRMLLPAGGLAIAAIVIATAVTLPNEGSDENSGGGGSVLSLTGPPAEDSGGATDRLDAPSSAIAPELAGEANSAADGESFDGSGPPVAPGPTHGNRAVERSAEIVLGANPADVAEDSAEVFDVVHAHDGIVMSSSTREGKPGQAGARFELLIPSAKLSDALAALSGIDEVRSRHEATADITAPTVNVSELLQDSNARIDSLLGQLAESETESEREAVEAELSQERRHRARLRANLQNLQRRADLSRVSLQIVTGAAEEPSGGGAWGVDDALGDAGKILAVAAAVAVVALAILGPIALIALLAWLTHRAWVRRERRRVLS